MCRTLRQKGTTICCWRHIQYRPACPSWAVSPQGQQPHSLQLTHSTSSPTNQVSPLGVSHPGSKGHCCSPQKAMFIFPCPPSAFNHTSWTARFPVSYRPLQLRQVELTSFSMNKLSISFPICHTNWFSMGRSTVVVFTLAFLAWGGWSTFLSLESPWEVYIEGINPK